MIPVNNYVHSRNLHSSVDRNCCEAQVLRIIRNRCRKIKTLTLIHPVVNPNIHEYCDKLGSF